MKWPRFIQVHTMAWLVGVGLLIYLALAPFVSGQSLQEISNSLILGSWTAVLVTWASAALFSIRRRAIGKNQLIIGVYTLAFVFVASRIYTVSYVMLDRPWWWPNETIIGFVGYLYAGAGILFLTAPANVDAPEPQYYRQLAIAALVGACMIFISYWAQTIGLVDITVRIQ